MSRWIQQETDLDPGSFAKQIPRRSSENLDETVVDMHENRNEIPIGPVNKNASKTIRKGRKQIIM